MEGVTSPSLDSPVLLFPAAALDSVEVWSGCADAFIGLLDGRLTLRPGQVSQGHRYHRVCPRENPLCLKDYKIKVFGGND